MKYLLTKSDKKTACIKDGCELKDFLTCYYQGNGSCVVWEKAQDRKSRKMQLEQLEKEGLLRCDFTIQKGKNRCYRKTCRRCAALREVA